MLGSGHSSAQPCSEGQEGLMEAPVLAHYDPTLLIRLAGDAFAYGIGAVLSHKFPDVKCKQWGIAYISRTLSKAEGNYVQLEKEALSLLFGVRKFHQYIYGRKFVLITDHQPLVTLFGPKKGIPSLAAAWLQRWALELSSYSLHH